MSALLNKLIDVLHICYAHTLYFKHRLHVFISVFFSFNFSILYIVQSCFIKMFIAQMKMTTNRRQEFVRFYKIEFRPRFQRGSLHRSIWFDQFAYNYPSDELRLVKHGKWAANNAYIEHVLHIFGFFVIVFHDAMLDAFQLHCVIFYWSNQMR